MRRVSFASFTKTKLFWSICSPCTRLSRFETLSPDKKISCTTEPGFLNSSSLKLTRPSLLGAWTIHIVLIIILKILFNIIPGVSQETSWTLTNIIYMFGSYLMFHYVRGVPFEFNAGAYDNLNMWEQIDNGDQYTPAKKFLLSVPICLFLLSTHYTHYDLTYFMINFLAVLSVVIPKLPSVSFLFSFCGRVSTDDSVNAEPSDACWTFLRWSRRSITSDFLFFFFGMSGCGERTRFQLVQRLQQF